MIPSFTTVEWAIIVGGVVSTITLIFVSLDFYWSHIVTERSDISIRKSVSRENNYSSTGNKRLSSACTLANEGKRTGVVRAKKADIRFEPLGAEFPWEDMQVMDSPSPPYVTIRHIEDNTVPADSTVEASVRFGPSDVDRINSLMDSQDTAAISCVIDVEDNEGHYQIEYSDEIELVG